jgi:glycine betaine/choline ABC-type transport system substrate-binding protein
VLAIGAELLFAALQRSVTPRGLKLTDHDPSHRRKHMRSRTVVALLAMSLPFGLIACGGSDSGGSSAAPAQSTTTPQKPAGAIIKVNPANAKRPTITVGSKNFTENLILAEIYAQALKAAGYNVKTQLNIGAEQIALKALKSSRIDAYPEYTGTIVTAFCQLKDKNVSRDPDQVYALAKSCIATQGIAALPRAPFTNSNGFAVTQQKAQELGGIRKLSDLAGKSQSLTISGPSECAQRTDCLLGLQQVYGLKFKKFLSVDISKRHDVIKSGQTDVGEVFTTDGQIKAENEVLLEDDRQLFPPYNGTLLTRLGSGSKYGPDFVGTIQDVQKGLTTPVIQELNSRVDIDKSKVADVATQYLKEAGFLSQ